MVGTAPMEGIDENQKLRSRPFVDLLKSERFFEFDVCLVVESLWRILIIRLKDNTVMKIIE